MQNKPTALQQKQLHALLNKVGDMAFKADYAIAASNGRTWHTSELQQSEFNKVINQLQGVLKFKYKALCPQSQYHGLQSQNGNQNNSQADIMRKKIISYCYSMQMTHLNGKINMQKVNNLVVTYGHLKPKSLNNYTIAELPVLITIVEKIYKNYTKKS